MKNPPFFVARKTDTPCAASDPSRQGAAYGSTPEDLLQGKKASKAQTWSRIALVFG